MSKKESYKKLFKQTFLFFLVTVFIFVPLVGIKLLGWKYSLRIPNALFLIFGLTVIRFMIGVINLTPRLRGPFRKVFSQVSYLPHVAPTSISQRKKSLLFLVIALSFVLPFVIEQYWLSVMITALIYVMLSLGLNIVIGFAGLLDLGYVAFFAVGAYGVALLHHFFQIDFWLAMPIAAFLAMLVGGLLAFPVLRMHGDYLAIVTLGFGEIIRLLLNNWTEFTRGPNGVILPRPYISFFGIPFDKNSPNSFHNLLGIEYSLSHKSIFLYLCLLLIVIAVTYFCLRLKKMPLGRSWEALREDEIACRSMGINHVTIKLFAFGLGAFFGGIGGGFFAALTEFVSPSSFTFIESALVVSIVVLGGLGSIPGVIIAAVVMTLLPEVLRDIANVRVLMFGVVMVVMMIWRPRGLTRVLRPRFNKTSK
ncbi:MAG: high-affinity branched-chain amino acid ABC transporter permease LivM [SAR324 cluster bacterium]|nr:high-affinity branched-chain amino acid ABC transporter permease LivM [SAR324 cluster bacterium]